MADFYLDKKYAITKSNEKLFIDFGELAKEYLRGSLLLLNDLTLGNMISSSISFSCTQGTVLCVDQNCPLS